MIYFIVIEEDNEVKIKHLQNFDHPLNHFISTSKNRYETIRYRNSTEAWKFSELEKFCFLKNFNFSRNFCKILRKIRNLATMTKRKKFSTETRKFPNLGREIFFSYRTVDRSPSKFCRWLGNRNNHTKN